MQTLFPVFNIPQMSKFYSSVGYEDRYNCLINAFSNKYNCEPDFICRAPGRVNIIGQHIDYEGYGVLPAAIEKDCLIAVKRIT